MKTNTINRKFKIWAALASLLSLLTLLGACDMDTKNGEVDLEEQQWQYLLFTRPTDATAACEASISAAVTCFTAVDSSGTTYLVYEAILESAYSFTAASPKGATEVCAELANSEYFPFPSNVTATGDDKKTITAGTRNCYFTCNQIYWERQSDAGSCTAANSANLTGTDDEVTSCVNLCLTRGTILQP